MYITETNWIKHNYRNPAQKNGAGFFCNVFLFLGHTNLLIKKDCSNIIFQFKLGDGDINF